MNRPAPSWHSFARINGGRLREQNRKNTNQRRKASFFVQFLSFILLAIALGYASTDTLVYPADTTWAATTWATIFSPADHRLVRPWLYFWFVADRPWLYFWFIQSQAKSLLLVCRSQAMALLLVYSQSGQRKCSLRTQPVSSGGRNVTRSLVMPLGDWDDWEISGTKVFD